MVKGCTGYLKLYILENTPKDNLERHQNGNSHKNAVKQKQLLQRMHAKGSIYKQIVTGVGNSNQSIVECNQRVIKKFMKTVYFSGPKTICN